MVRLGIEDMRREDLLDVAKEITKGHREEHYGSPEDNFQNIANLWSTYLHDKVISAEDVAVMMILMKAARLKSDITHVDSWIDIAGYAACGCEIVTKGKVDNAHVA